MTPSKAKRVIVTEHAKKRLLQRARLFLRESEIENLSHFIENEFRKSNIDFRIENCPAWKNILCVRHGEDAFKSNTKDFIFQGVHDKRSGTVMIKTVLYSKNLPSGYRPI